MEGDDMEGTSKSDDNIFCITHIPHRTFHRHSYATLHRHCSRPHQDFSVWGRKRGTCSIRHQHPQHRQHEVASPSGEHCFALALTLNSLLGI
eukprot:1090884-Pelagomonas_calceolata.AAC.2